MRSSDRIVVAVRRPDRAAAVVAALAFGLLSTVAPFTPEPAHPKTLSTAAPVLPVPTPVVRTEMALRAGSPPAVALTFDDGPDPRWTPDVLDLLRRHGAVATFCVVGEQVAAHPDLVRDIVAAGHRLCDHTRTHDEGLPARSAEDMADEIVGARDDLAAVVDAHVAYFRAPGGNWSPDVLELAVGSGMQPLGWSVDPRDWRRPGATAIVEAVQREVRPGAVILLHDGGGRREQTVAALARLLPWLVDHGYGFAFPHAVILRGAAATVRRMARLVRDLMTARVVTVRSDEPMSAAVERMTRFGFSALPVVTASFRLVGMVSLLDVLRCREEHQAEGVEADDRIPVEEIMNPDVLSMSAAANIGAVAQRMRSHGELRVLPVVQGGKLVGVITRSDLLRHRTAARGPRRLFAGRNRAEDDALFALARTRRTGPAPAATTGVAEVMTREVDTVRSGDHVSVAAELMLHHRHTALPVVDGDRLVGILSEADILADPLAGRSAHATVGSVMTRTPITVDVGATLGQARAVVADHGLRTLPVVDGDRLVGVLSRSDLV